MAMSNYPIYSVIGIEIEYMLTDIHSLDIQPKSDLVLQALAGKQVNEIALGNIAVSNEFVMHVLELKTNGPAPIDAPIALRFQTALEHIGALLKEKNLQFLPGAAHPWMDPTTETTRWPYDNHDIYQQYDKIFNCKGHGWANLQSMHVNLPFANDEEFKHLHSAIRLILPLLPALAASSPILDSIPTGVQDARLSFYAKNQERVPSITGEVIPEFISSEKEYREKILKPMYQDISPYDKEGILQYEWLNSRGAIPKFGYKAIEIRILDSQEYIDGDIAIAKAIFAILKKWHHHSEYFLDRPCSTVLLKNLYDKTRVNGLTVPIESLELKRQWQLTKPVKNCRDVLSTLIEDVSTELDSASQKALEMILSQGNLSERIIQACHKDFSRASLKRVYQRLGECLQTNEALIC